MSDTHLPNDPNEWPRDPHALLGITRKATAREIKRAYTQLIRVYKPEHAPEQFRRIREAYEAASRMAEYYAAEPDAPAEPTKPPEPLHTVTLEDEARRAWSHAVAGDEATAYRALVALVERTPTNRLLYAQLYWLSRVFPAVNPTGDAAEWLVRGLRACQLDATLVELYHDECRRVPAEHHAERGRSLLAILAPQSAFTNFLSRRWNALLRASEWDILRADIQRVATRMQADAPVDWLRLMVQLSDWLLWDDQLTTDPLMDDIFDELHHLNGLALQHSYWFDRLDQLRYLVRQQRHLWVKKRAGLLGTKELRALQRDAWRLPFEEVRPALERFMADLCAHPAIWLERFDQLDRENTGFIELLRTLFDQYEMHTSTEFDPPADEKLWLQAAEHIMYGRSTTQQIRKRIFHFCFHHGLDTAQVCASYFADHQGKRERDRIPGWLGPFLNDTTLGLLLRGCRLLRA